MAPLSPQSPPRIAVTPQQWLKKNLFSSIPNTVLTILSILFLGLIFQSFWSWLQQAQWSVVTSNLRLFWVGRYPEAQLWRMWAILGIGVAAFVMSITIWWTRSQSKNSTLATKLQTLQYCLLPVGAIAIVWLVNGGLGLPLMRTSLWGGLFLTLFTAAISVLLAFPLSILLAIGRRSQQPITRWLCTGYIELVRGLPLIGILFMAQVMLPLVMPPGFRLDRLLRAIAGLTLFNAAYLAENIRAGLQAIPHGQMEAARSLGLSGVQTLRWIVLPQALRLVTPAIVGQFISLFKDTSLLALFALFELTGTARTVLSQPQFLGRNAEVYLFIGLIYWIVCFTLSRFSQRLEVRS